MAHLPPGNSPISRDADAIPARNGDAHPNGDLKNGSRVSSVSPDEDASRTNEGSDASTTPRQSRKSSHKAPKRERPLFSHMPDVTEEACRSFKVIEDCLYGSKSMGATNCEPLDCECRPEWRK